MHLRQMLFEVIQTWPNLCLDSTPRNNALVEWLSYIDSVHAFLMSLKVVESSKALCTTLAIWYVALEQLVVLQPMFAEKLLETYPA
jgi:hypothetical protein